MSSNTFGKLFTLTSAGESHGTAMVAIVDGCPAGLSLIVQDIQQELDRRRPGQSSVTTQRQEQDRVEILSGVFEDKTTGAPIALLIRNEDARERDYANLKEVFRPGHADYTYFKKYGIRDHRGGGRASARETVLRVAAGAIAKKYLREHYQVEVKAYVQAIGAIVAEKVDLSEVANNSFYFPDATKLSSLEALITELRRKGDSIG
ncbi:MAG TPA: chorismate synthase, partial [Coxiellaceae bacterium]|nr:chorismate synthase [Coxiellaceae bacterium]